MNKVISIPSLFALVLLLLSVQFIFAAGSWTEAPNSPPYSNADAPINVGVYPQAKDGTLTVTQFFSSSNWPSLFLQDNDGASDWLIRAASNASGVTRLMFLEDVNKNGNFWDINPSTGEAIDKRPFEIRTDHVRAEKYCDLSGGNCIDPTDPTVPTSSCADGQVQVWDDTTSVWECSDVPGLGDNRLIFGRSVNGHSDKRSPWTEVVTFDEPFDSPARVSILSVDWDSWTGYENEGDDGLPVEISNRSKNGFTITLKGQTGGETIWVHEARWVASPSLNKGYDASYIPSYHWQRLGGTPYPGSTPVEVCNTITLECHDESGKNSAKSNCDADNIPSPFIVGTYSITSCYTEPK